MGNSARVKDLFFLCNVPPSSPIINHHPLHCGVPAYQASQQDSASHISRFQNQSQENQQELQNARVLTPSRVAFNVFVDKRPVHSLLSLISCSMSIRGRDSPLFRVSESKRPIKESRTLFRGWEQSKTCADLTDYRLSMHQCIVISCWTDITGEELHNFALRE